MVTENYNVKVRVEGQNQLKQLNASTIRIQNSLGGLGTAAKLATGAIAALGAARIGRSFLNVATSVETLQQRFKFLFGTAEEGAKAFDTLSKFAGTVPFSLEEISSAAGVLAVVSKDAEQLGENLVLTGNVAAVTGLDFRTAGEQIQRALSGGIGAADLLREKGVRDLLGFKAGVTVTATETAEALERVFGPNGKFGDASVALASTFTGLVSMVGDKMFQFQKLVMDAGPFDFLKSAVAVLNDELTEQFGSIEESAKAIGAGIVSAAETALVGTGYLLDSMAPVIDFFTDAFNNIMRAVDGIHPALKFAGVIGFLMLGFKAKMAVVFIGGIFDEIMKALANFYSAVASVVVGVGNLLEKIGLTALGNKFKESGEIAKQASQDFIDSLDRTADGFMESEESVATFMEKIESGEIVLGKYGKQLYELVLALRTKQKELELTREEADKLKKVIEDTTKSTKASSVTFANLKKTFITTFDEMYDKFNPVQEGVDLLIKSFETFKRGVGDAFADAIMGAKTFSEALSEVGRAIIKQLISGIIQLGLEIFVFDVIREKLKAIKNEQQNLNQALGVELGLRAALAFFTGGSSIGIPFLAEGGAAKRNHPYIVGEQGPELFVPNNSGTVVPNEQLSMTSSAGTGDVNINFNISTVDARGFDELLLSRRAMITGIINEGVTRKGRKAIV